MSHRRLVLVSGLTLADYLLWNSSLGGTNSVVATISGLSLLPLVLATAWLFVLSGARLLTERGGARPTGARAASRTSDAGLARLRADGAPRDDLTAPASRAAAAARAPSDKIAA